MFHRIACLSDNQLLAALAAERVTKSVRRQLIETYEEETGQTVRLDMEDVAERVRELFLPADL